MKGPEFLKLPEEQWPVQTAAVQRGDMELCHVNAVSAVKCCSWHQSHKQQQQQQQGIDCPPGNLPRAISSSSPGIDCQVEAQMLSGRCLQELVFSKLI